MSDGDDTVKADTNPEAQAIRQAADDLRANVYNPAQTDYQRTYNAAMGAAADFLVSRANELEVQP